MPHGQNTVQVTYRLVSGSGPIHLRRAGSRQELVVGEVGAEQQERVGVLFGGCIQRMESLIGGFDALAQIDQ